MILRKWEELPEFMRTDEVRPYYEILNKRRGSLVLKRMMDLVGGLVLLVLLAIPMAIARANSKGKLANTALPTVLIRIKIWLSSVPEPMRVSSPYCCTVAILEKDAPIPSSSPATGKMEIGRKKERPMVCITVSILCLFGDDIKAPLDLICRAGAPPLMISFLERSFNTGHEGSFKLGKYR